MQVTKLFNIGYLELISATVLVVGLLFPIALSANGGKNQDIQSIINKSVASYKGNCPCPWSTMKNGRKCGKNSAWSKPGGAKPICYSSDIK